MRKLPLVYGIALRSSWKSRHKKPKLLANSTAKTTEDRCLNEVPSHAAGWVCTGFSPYIHETKTMGFRVCVRTTRSS